MTQKDFCLLDRRSSTKHSSKATNN